MQRARLGPLEAQRGPLGVVLVVGVGRLGGRRQVGELAAQCVRPVGRRGPGREQGGPRTGRLVGGGQATGSPRSMTAELPNLSVIARASLPVAPISGEPIAACIASALSNSASALST